MENKKQQIIDVLKEKDNTAKEYYLSVKVIKSPDLLIPNHDPIKTNRFGFFTILTKENADGSFQESRTSVFNTEAETLDACLESCKTDQNNWKLIEI